MLTRSVTVKLCYSNCYNKDIYNHKFCTP